VTQASARIIMRIAELWRYPVKSLAGERLDGVEVTAAGMAGDRIVQVRNGRDRVITSRTAPRLLALRGTWDTSAGEPLVNGLPWQSASVAEAVRRAAGAGARLVRFEGVERFDVLPLLVATDGAIARLGADHRRLRPNVLIEGVDGLAEREWPGRRLRLGPVVIEVASVRRRCVMTTYDPDTQEQNLDVLRRIVNEFGGRMALDCVVVEGGHLTVGDPVEVTA
jgi:MOSC domain-containing protein